jgi:hypothetical protein
MIFKKKLVEKYCGGQQWAAVSAFVVLAKVTAPQQILQG